MVQVTAPFDGEGVLVLAGTALAAKQRRVQLYCCPAVAQNPVVVPVPTATTGAVLSQPMFFASILNCCKYKSSNAVNLQQLKNSLQNPGGFLTAAGSARYHRACPRPIQY